MNTEAKARVAALICGMFVFWPAVHRTIVSHYDTNAWQLGGFAMYATPPARTRISMFEKLDRRKNLLEGEELPTALMEQRRLSIIRRGILGSLSPPDMLADAFFAARPTVEHIEVVITREMLGVSTARIEREETVYAYDRCHTNSCPQSVRSDSTSPPHPRSR